MSSTVPQIERLLPPSEWHIDDRESSDLEKNDYLRLPERYRSISLRSLMLRRLRHAPVHLLQLASSPGLVFSILQSILLSLLPSFTAGLVRWRLDSKNISESARIDSIAALDGLRGWCCLAVVNMHWSYAVTDSYADGTGETNARLFFHRPFIHLLWAGVSHVNIFFVISGYVLSVKCLKIIYSGSSDFHKALASSVFRRGIRIFLPPVAILVIYLVAIRLGVFDKGIVTFKDVHESHAYPLALFESPPPVLPTFLEQFWDVLGSIVRLMDPHSKFDLPNYEEYDSHLWTMPTEFYCSMGLYLVLVGTSRLQTAYRLALHSGFACYCWLTAEFYPGLFCAGMLIAELDVIFKRRLDLRTQVIQSFDSKRAFCRPTTAGVQPSTWSVLVYYLTLSNLTAVASFISGLYLLSIPLVFGEKTPGYITLNKLVPSYLSRASADALRALGAILVFWPISWSCVLTNCRDTPSFRLTQLVFSNPISAYLGRISFAMYLVHGFVIRSLGYAILPRVYKFVVNNPTRLSQLSPNQTSSADTVMPREHLTSSEVGSIWLTGYLIVLPACIWTADLFWRGVDLRCLALGRWVECMMNRSEAETESTRQSSYS